MKDHLKALLACPRCKALFGSDQLAKLAARLVFPLRLLDRFIPASFASDVANGVWFPGKRSKTPLSRHAMPDLLPRPAASALKVE